MTNKNFCDTCGKEIKDGFLLFRERWNLFSSFISKDFCSKECLIKFMETI